MAECTSISSVKFVQTRNFLDIFNDSSPQEWISNFDVELHEIRCGEHLFPATLNRSYYTNSYTTSFYSANISYAKDELHLIGSPLTEWIAKALLNGAGLIFKHFQCDNMAIINNWGFSTNFHPSLGVEEVDLLTNDSVMSFPSAYIALRSLNSLTDADLIEALRERGWSLLPARSVYMFDTTDTAIFKHNHTKKDQKLLSQTTLELVTPSQWREEDFPHIKELFDKLFIEKHSHLNPDFSTEFLHQLHQKGIIEFYGFKENGTIVAFIGFFVSENIISTPMLGYDTQLPQEMGLYRLLMALLLKTAKERGLMLNLSSGAGSFKRSRGGKATLEYTAIYSQHLSPTKQSFIRNLSKLLNRYLPDAFEKYQI
jgi:hypothetical protein